MKPHHSIVVDCWFPSYMDGDRNDQSVSAAQDIVLKEYEQVRRALGRNPVSMIIEHKDKTRVVFS